MTLPVVFTANGPSGYNLTNSLRFRASASAWLNRTFGTPTLSTKWTWSGWFKLGSLTGTNKIIFDGGSPDTRLVLQDISNGPEQLIVGNDTTTFLATSAVYRDYSAWYHAVLAFDSSQGTASNRLRLYVNGSEVTAFATDNRSSISGAIGINTATAHGIGKQPAGGVAYFDGYMAEINFVDGQQLTPSSFGETSTSTGVWIPKKYTGTYGNNGFYLPFTDNSALTTSSNVGLGKDFSGNANYWITNNISITSGSTYDSMTDVPTLTSATTANYCTLNAALQAGGYTLNDGNLNWSRTGATGGGSDRSQFGTIGVTSGKWYWEFTAGTTNANSLPAFGIAIGSASTQSWAGNQTGAYIYNSDGTKNISGTNSAYGASFTTGDIIGVVFDADAGTLTFYKNNTSQGTAASGLTSGPYFPAVTRSVGGGGSNGTEIANFGQRPFAYTPPTGFVALNTFNLPTPTIGATASTQAGKYMNAVTYTGTSGTQSVTGVGFQPDFVWIKNRTSTLSHVLQDVVRGTTAYLISNATTAENTNTANNWFRSFNSDGFTVATLTDPGGVSTNEWNNTGYNYVSWNWKANGAGSSNTAGSITSTVSANTTAGFSIVTYTGTGANATVGHGLGVAPSMYITKSRSTSGYDWMVYHVSLGNTKYIYLSTTDAAGTSSLAWNNTSPTSSVFSLGTGTYGNASGTTYVAYCFAPIAGYSAFGSYTGNGSTDGPFIFTGFRPRFVMFKGSSIASNWCMLDSSRNTYNLTDATLQANSSAAELTNLSDVDFLSNGIKIRDVVTNDTNVSGQTYIYMAFAESPFKYANAR
jgi:hypothetical protein